MSRYRVIVGGRVVGESDSEAIIKAIYKDWDCLPSYLGDIYWEDTEEDGA